MQLAPFRQVDLSNVPDALREARVRELAAKESRQSFDLSQAPLLRALLVRVGDDEHVFLLIGHRTLCDAASLEILLEETAAHYRRSQDLAAARQYSSLISFGKNGGQQQFTWWEQTLAGAPASLDLPTDLPRPAQQTFRGATEKFSIDKSCLDQLKEVAKSYDSTRFAMLLAVFYVLLWRYSRQDDIVVGMPISGRDGKETEKVVGPVENMVALRVDLSGTPTFTELLGRIDSVVREALDHQDMRIEALLNHLPLERDLSRAPLFQVTFGLQQQESHPNFGKDVRAEKFEVETGAEAFDLSFDFVDCDDRIEGRLGYNTDLFDAPTIERMIGHFLTLLRSVLDKPGQAIATVPLLTATERHRLVEWNQAPVEYKPEKCIHEWVEAQVARTPNAVAVVCEGQSLTYGELNLRANQLARYLKKRGIGPETLVAMCMERSLDMIVSIIGVLKAGGAYLPLDLSYPPERLAFIIEDAHPPVMLTQQDLEAKLPQHKAEIVCVDRDWPIIVRESGDNLSSGVGAQNLAYVIYTSGSTGKPKGCQITHYNVVRLFQATWDWYKFDESDVWSLFHSYAFDFSVWEIWGALFYGGRLVIVPKDVARSPEDFYELLCREKVTVLNQTPSAFRQLISAQGKSKESHRLRYVVFGGEALETSMLKPWYEQNQAQNTQLINMYGITETTVHVTFRPLTPADTEKRGGSPVGCRIPDLRTYILDGERQPVPIGVVGELYVGGAGVARGYLNRVELTAERFLRDPFVKEPGKRMYKTGDLGRWRGEGDIEFLGRNDSQVKIRGFRIELGEIEARLAEKTGVREAVVILREDTPGEKRLVAYYTCSKEPVSAEALRMHLSGRLPEHMVPAAYVRLEAVPLTTNGKLDRKALPVPDTDAYGVGGYEAPAGPIEEALAKIWAEVLKVPRVGRHDDFFALGGHSLLAGRLLSRIGQVTGHQIPLSALFRSATIESLAQLVQHGTELGNDPVVMEIQHGISGRLPFFAIVPPGEDSLGYAMLARHMGRDQTVYKVQAHSPVVRNRPYTEQEMCAISREYAAAIVDVQPKGPYCLGGMCDGTHIAERVTLELEAQNREVGLFAIFDTWTLQHSQRRWLWRLYYYQQRIQEIRNLDLGKQFETYASIVANKIAKLTGKVRIENEWPQAYWPKDFVPRPFRAPIALFKRPVQPFYYVKDTEMGWGQRSEAGVEIHLIPFDHNELLREPHVQTLGEGLAACIERVSQGGLFPTRYRESGASSPVTPGGAS